MFGKVANNSSAPLDWGNSLKSVWASDKHHRETDEEIREKHRKIYKDLKPLSRDDFSNPSREQKKELQKQEARDGKVVVKKVKDKDEEEKLPTLTTYKYSNNGKGNLYESVLICGQPCFITYNHKSSKVEIYPGIQQKFRILYPAEPSDYSYPPYEFASREELERVCSAANKENLDTLLSRSESIVSKYNDQDQHKITSIASDVVWSYFQDRFATTRYEVLVGGVGSGKSAFAAYFWRNRLSTCKYYQPNSRYTLSTFGQYRTWSMHDHSRRG